MEKKMRGESKFGCLVTILLLAAGLYVGYKFGKAQWDYQSMKDEVFEMTKFTAATPNFNYAKVQESIIRQGKKLGITIYPEDIAIIDNEISVTLEVYWETELVFSSYTHTLDYFVTFTRKKGL